MRDENAAPITNLEEGLARAAQSLAGEPDVVVAYLFGSRARGDAVPASDADIAVLLKHDADATYGGARYLELLDLMTRAFRSDAVDLVTLNDAPYLLQHRVIRDGRVFFCRDEAARVTYEARALDAFLDFRYYLDRAGQTTLRQLKEGQYGRPR
jgi:hypothetical protein